MADARTTALRFVTATSLFDGHDASINLIRRLLQAEGCEVVHLGHNRSVAEIADAAVDEDVHGVAISSYQGGHMEFFTYLVDELARRGRPGIRVFGGGGGVIIPKEIAELEDHGVARIFSPDDGARLGLAGMAAEMCALARATERPRDERAAPLLDGDRLALARAITAIEAGELAEPLAEAIRTAAANRRVPVLGITGTGGSGKSSLTDELLRRFRLDLEDKLRIAVIAVDPTRRRGGGALLGDRIRMNAIDTPQIYFRSLGAGGAPGGIPAHLAEVLGACAAWGAELVVVETPGIGQGDAGIEALADVSLYVMTPEYGAPTQLEKIEMLDVADAVAINKFERRGANDALREVRRQVARLRGQRGVDLEQLPVFGTIAARFNDDGVTALYHELRRALGAHGLTDVGGVLADPGIRASTHADVLIAPDRVGYLGEIARTVRDYHRATERLAHDASVVWALRTAASHLEAKGAPTDELRREADAADGALDPALRAELEAWPEVASRYAGPTTEVGGRDVALHRTTLSGSAVPRVAVPATRDAATLVRYLRGENLPGRFPFTAGVFAFKRDDEEPTRMFAGEGDAARTNRRFHLLAAGQPSTRLSTAFDSVTLYGFDPDERPDIFGKVGNAGVSVATIEDMAVLYDGFDLCASSTSVSMTINGPAPAILAMFLNVAADQHVAAAERDAGRALDAAAATATRRAALATVRGTVQADILKEDQGQNTCILSTEFALRMMGDVQQYFVDHGVQNFYSVSISGYHIAEAGANPITQLALTLSNGFTYVESWLARGMDVEAFAPSLSFFFSNGMDAEYTVLGRVARRIWAIVLRDRYGASERAQKLKYHAQTSGRSLHAQEMTFNDIRTTLQALCAIYDNCNSLHTNAFDEAVTTPTGESVRRAMAIQLIINREWGLAGCDNPLQGAYVVDELTALVEEAVLSEFERINERGGVLGAMELGYQRGRIQDESMAYEQRKHDGSLPIVGVNTFLDPDAAPVADSIELARSTIEERTEAVERVRAFRAAHAHEREAALTRLRDAALAGENTFEVLMDVVRCCSLGEITETLFEVGGRYRRNL
ncbi:MAG TPA: fused isobutyryl-CoA mutase/GTPase IcmF [Acidimicrobiales bacterium]|jgi:methylmalonyl-CoA mutase|nr:fused isobutyryl-CoA mutase/GTPase IcmF [Acidimicrobiales bacterium]